MEDNPYSLTPPPQNAPKKGLPTFFKILLAFFIFGFFCMVLVVMGFTFLAHFFTTDTGKKTIQTSIETFIEKTAEKEGKKVDVNIDWNKNGFTVKDEKSNEVLNIQGDGQMPKDFPKEIPLFNPTHIEGSMNLGPMKMVSYLTENTLVEVKDFYDSQLGKLGWNLVSNGSGEQGEAMSIYQKDPNQIQIALSQEKGKTLVVLSFIAPTH